MADRFEIPIVTTASGDGAERVVSDLKKVEAQANKTSASVEDAYRKQLSSGPRGLEGYPGMGGAPTGAGAASDSADSLAGAMFSPAGIGAAAIAASFNAILEGLKQTREAALKFDEAQIDVVNNTLKLMDANVSSGEVDRQVIREKEQLTALLEKQNLAKGNPGLMDAIQKIRRELSLWASEDTDRIENTKTSAEREEDEIQNKIKVLEMQIKVNEKLAAQKKEDEQAAKAKADAEQSMSEQGSDMPGPQIAIEMAHAEAKADAKREEYFQREAARQIEKYAQIDRAREQMQLSLDLRKAMLDGDEDEVIKLKQIKEYWETVERLQHQGISNLEAMSMATQQLNLENEQLAADNAPKPVQKEKRDFHPRVPRKVHGQTDPHQGQSLIDANARESDQNLPDEGPSADFARLGPVVSSVQQGGDAVKQGADELQKGGQSLDAAATALVTAVATMNIVPEKLTKIVQSITDITTRVSSLEANNQ